MTYGTSLGVSMPAVGAAGPGTALATQINACVDAIIARLESKVTVAGLDINADLSIKSGSTSYGLKDVQRVSLTDVVAALSAVTYPGALYRVGSDLYFNDAAGNQVRMVTGGTLDVSGLGGITGAGYGASGVEVNWDGTNYRFKNGSGADNYTAIVVDDVLLRDGSGNAIRLGSPALGADYTITLPNAVPASNSILAMDTSGAISNAYVHAAGTFTPILQNNNADHGGGYTHQQGYYIRFGNVVWFTLSIIATSLDPAGTLRIKVSSLPVAPSVSTVSMQAGVVGQFTGGGGTGTDFEVRTDNNGIYLDEPGNSSHKDWTALTNGTYTIRLAGFYLIA